MSSKFLYRIGLTKGILVWTLGVLAILPLNVPRFIYLCPLVADFGDSMFEKISSVMNSSETSSGTSGLSGFFAGKSLFFFKGLSASLRADLTVISGDMDDVFDIGRAGISLVPT